MSNRRSIIWMFVSIIIMIIFLGLTSAGLMGDSPVGQTTSTVEPLVVPAGYAFSIWSIIYLGLIIFPIYQWFRRIDIDPTWRKIHWFYCFNVILNGVWLVFASYNWFWMTVITIVGLLVTLYYITELLLSLKDSEKSLNFWTEELVFRIYFAWVTLATALNISAALNFYQWDGWGVSKVTWSVIVLSIAALVAGRITWIRRDSPFGLVVIWAFVALFIRHYPDLPVLAYFSLTIVMVFTLLLFVRRPLSTAFSMHQEESPPR